MLFISANPHCSWVHFSVNFHQSPAELHWTEHRIMFSFFHSLSVNLLTAITIRDHQLILNYKGTLVGLPITAALMPKLVKVMNVLHWIPTTLIIILPFIESVANLPLILKKRHIFIHLKIKSCAHEIYTKALSCGSERMLASAHLMFPLKFLMLPWGPYT